MKSLPFQFCLLHSHHRPIELFVYSQCYSLVTSIICNGNLLLLIIIFQFDAFLEIYIGEDVANSSVSVSEGVSSAMEIVVITPLINVIKSRCLLNLFNHIPFDLFY